MLTRSLTVHHGYLQFLALSEDAHGVTILASQNRPVQIRIAKTLGIVFFELTFCETILNRSWIFVDLSKNILGMFTNKLLQLKSVGKYLQLAQLSIAELLSRPSWCTTILASKPSYVSRARGSAWPQAECDRT